MSDTEPRSPIEPMEALLVDALPTEGGWQFEPKWDGFRCIAVKRGSDVQLFAKSGKVLHRYFPEIVAALGGLDADFILDGELAVPVGDSLDSTPSSSGCIRPKAVSASWRRRRRRC